MKAIVSILPMLRRAAVAALLALPVLAAGADPVQGGWLDLGAGDFPQREVTALDGEWEFVPGRLVGPTERWPAEASTLLHVPGRWSGVTHFAYGAGTYRLRVRCLDSRQIALSLPFQSTAAAYFVNGREVERQGRPGLTPDTHVAAGGSRTRVLEPTACPLELRVQLSNLELYRGGLTNRMYLGTRERILKRRDLERTIEVGAIATGAVLGVFGILLSLGRPRDPLGLIFGLFAMCLAVFVGFTGESVLQPLIDDFSFQTQLRIFFVSIFVWFAVHPLLWQHLYPRQAGRALPLAIVGFCGGCVILCLVAPPRPFPPSGPLTWFAWFAVEAHAGYALVRACRHRERGALIVLASLGLLVAAATLDTFPAIQLRYGQALPVGMAGVVIALALQIGQRLRRALAAEELRAIEQGQRVDLLLRATKAGVLDWDSPSGIVRASERYREMLGLGDGQAAMRLSELWDTVHEEDRAYVHAVFEQRLRERGQGVRQWEQMEFRMRRADGPAVWVQSEAISIFGADGLALRHIWTFVEISHLKTTEQKLLDAQARLLAEARRAGMAQIATNVLHNVGNVLTSVNVSAHVLESRLRQSRTGRVADIAQLLQDNRADLPGFFDRDKKARMLPEYVQELGAALAAERADLLAELARLGASVDHIKNVVATQQSYAGASGVLEQASLTLLADDALRMHEEALERDGVVVVRDYAQVEVLPLDRTRVMQVLVNLIENARHAMKGMPGEHRLALAIRRGEGWVEVSVSDSGCGIAAENIAKIFSHGFTTKQQGHGFGLHSCAVAAREMGGTLAVHSDGPGLGARFTLWLSVAPHARTRGVDDVASELAS